MQILTIHLRPLKAGLHAMLLLSLAVGLYVVQFANGTNPIAYLESRPQWALLILIGYAGSVWFAVGGLSLLWILLARGGCPLFRMGSRLVYLNPLLWSVRIDDVAAQVAPGDFVAFVGRGKGIRFPLRSGREKWLPLTLIAGDVPQVARALNEALWGL